MHDTAHSLSDKLSNLHGTAVLVVKLLLSTRCCSLALLTALSAPYNRVAASMCIVCAALTQAPATFAALLNAPAFIGNFVLA